MITDTQKREDLYFDKEFLDATLPMINEWLNELAEENEQLKSHINDTQIAVEIETEKCMNNVFECIDELIERAKQSGSSNQYKLGAIQVLQTLEKELIGDVE